MKRQIRLARAASFIALSLFFTRCGMQGGLNGGSLNGGNTSGSSFNSGTLNPASNGSLTGINSALGSIAQSDPSSQSAVTSAQNGLSSLSNGYNALQNAQGSGGGNFTGALGELIQALSQSQSGLSSAAQYFQGIQQLQLAQALQALSVTAPVWRLDNGSTDDHVYDVASPNPVLQASNQAPAGYAFAGEGFHTFQHGANIYGCNTPLYRCVENANGDHFISTQPTCEGNTPMDNGTPLGDVCPSQSTTALLPLQRGLCPDGHHFTTADQNEVSTKTAAGCTIEGYQGYMPN